MSSAASAAAAMGDGTEDVSLTEDEATPTQVRCVMCACAFVCDYVRMGY
jgi:hypothetical protein